MKIKDFLPNKMRVVGFVGPSGTGKSYRAQMVAGDNDIEYIIDDGILIKGNEIIAGHSAKKATTKIETVKKALFFQKEEREEIQKAIKKYKPNAILILGTSDEMVHKIAQNLELPPISQIVRIEDVATTKEMEDARRTRVVEGKHVIPVPTFQIKKEFSGYLLDPLQIFKTKGKGNAPYISEKSIIRPTFSYLGNFTISDNVLKQIIQIEAKKIEGIYKINKIRIDTSDSNLDIYVELTVLYGANLRNIIDNLKQNAIKQIDKLTTMNVNDFQIRIVNLYVPEKENKKEQKEQKDQKDQSKLKDEKDIKINTNSNEKQIKEEIQNEEMQKEENKFKIVDKNQNSYKLNKIDQFKMKIERKLNKK